MATYAFTINAVSKQFQIDSLDIREVLHGTDTFLCDVVSTNGSYRPALFDELILTENSIAIFGGYIDDVEETGAGGIPGSGANPINLRISAVGYNTVASWVHVTESIPSGGTLKAALQVLDDYLPSGFALHASQGNGPTLTEDLEWDGVLLSDALNQLFGMTGWFWRIDNDKKLRMMDIGTDAAPFDVTTANRKAIGDVRVKRSRQNYANRIIVKYGEGVVTEKTEEFTGNGSTTEFFLSYQAVHVVDQFIGYGYVTNQGVNETLSFAGGGGTWIYDPTNNSIERTSAPANGNLISFKYDAQFPATVTVEDTGSQPPVITRTVLLPSVFDVAVATSIADGLLAKATADQKTVEYRTYDMGIHPGQSQEVDLPNRDLTTDDVLVSEVTTKSIRSTQTDHKVIRTVRAEVGTDFYGSWRDVYRDWLNTGGGTTVISGGALVPPMPSPGVGGNFMHFSIGHPNGQIVAPVGHACIRDDGRWYLKQGGAASAYGWYPLLTDVGHTVGSYITAMNGTSAAATGILNIQAITLTGTMAGAPNASGNAVTLTTAGTTASQAGVRNTGTGPASMQIGQEFDFWCIMETQTNISNLRLWIGLGNTATGMGNLDNQAFDNYSFRFSTVAGDTGWRGVVDDEGGSGQTLTSNIGTVAADTRYVLRIRGDTDPGDGTNDNIYFSVDDGTEVLISSGLPTANWMGMNGMITTTENVAKEWIFYRMRCVAGFGIGMY